MEEVVSIIAWAKDTVGNLGTLVFSLIFNQEPSSDLDQTVRKKNWECGEPEGKKDMVKNPKKRPGDGFTHRLGLLLVSLQKNSTW